MGFAVCQNAMKQVQDATKQRSGTMKFREMAQIAQNGPKLV